ncbi:hypothetical protein N7G274_004394 [Stereocaulon virgatum]|uniref:Chromo domain-containing protein n=1 Tax=Stereocaulon virgatum TaxID=373712 RepID=A0ABR4AA34_9LECA
MCEFEDGQHKSVTPDPSSDDDARGQQDDKEAEIDNEEEGYSGDSKRDTLPYLHPTKKRSLRGVGETPRKTRLSKRLAFSSRIESDAETVTVDESVISSDTPSKPRHSSKPRPTSSHLTSLQGDISDDGVMDLVGGGSQMAVTYEQQSWKGEIVQERDVKQWRGWPRKQYLVQWEQSWVDGGRLTAPELLQSWREKKASKSRH